MEMEQVYSQETKLVSKYVNDLNSAWINKYIRVITAPEPYYYYYKNRTRSTQ